MTNKIPLKCVKAEHCVLRPITLVIHDQSLTYLTDGQITRSYKFIQEDQNTKPHMKLIIYGFYCLRKYQVPPFIIAITLFAEPLFRFLKNTSSFLSTPPPPICENFVDSFLFVNAGKTVQKLSSQFHCIWLTDNALIYAWFHWTFSKVLGQNPQEKKRLKALYNLWKTRWADWLTHYFWWTNSIAQEMKLKLPVSKFKGWLKFVPPLIYVSCLSQG